MKYLTILGARLVGRWKSGAPIDLSPFKDDPVQDLRKSPWRLVSIPDRIFQKRAIRPVPFGQELDLASKIAGSRVWTGLRS